MRATRPGGDILRIARLRWEERLSQVDIAQRLGVSASTVSRSLRRALDLGLVEIRIAPGALREQETERRILATFGLDHAVVVETRGSRTETRRILGEAVARHLDALVGPGTVIGVSDGETTAAVARAALRTRAPDVHVVALIGGIGAPEQPSHPGEVCRALAQALGARAWLLPVPAMVDDAATAAGLRAQSSVREVFGMMERLAVALVGVGDASAGAAIVRHGVVSPEAMLRMAARGAVGTICARYFDAEGKPMRSTLDDRTLAITPEALRRTPQRLAVAFGPEKVAALRAAVAAGWVNGIATDLATAEALLQIKETQR